MQLLMHNTLVCPASGGYPLKIVASSVTTLAPPGGQQHGDKCPPSSPAAALAQQQEREERRELVRTLLPRLDWATLVAGATDLGLRDRLPAEPPALGQSLALGAGGDDGDGAADDGGDLSVGAVEVIDQLAEVLMDVEVLQGELHSPCGRHRYAVHDGIANMVVDLSHR
eukprot:COSAG01_NODE_6718_length_3530_cov_5.092101_7_plen_168_part_01